MIYTYNIYIIYIYIHIFGGGYTYVHITRPPEIQIQRLGGEIHVARGIDEIHQVGLLSMAISLVVLQAQGHTGTLDGDATFLLILDEWRI